MSIVRIGLAETKGFDEGYEAIFGKKKAAAASKDEAKKTEAELDEAAEKAKKAKKKSKKK